VTWDGLNPPYKTIVADPPWAVPYKLTGVTRVGRMKRDRSVAYSTMSIEDIRALPVADLAERVGSHLYLWATNVHLREAFGVMEAWGFTYKTTLTWVKQGNIGLGKYFRSQTEHVLFGVMGSLATLSRTQRTFFEAPKAGHSVKPPAFMDIVEVCSPGPYVELFARQPRFGWDSWGLGYEELGA
jgi:N6-adenosine-specific RNA methylase IME4